MSDAPEQLRAVVEAALEAGATHVSPILLHLRPGVREGFMDWLEGAHPDLVDRYRRMYDRPYGPPSARRELGARVGSIVRAMGGVAAERHDEREERHDRRWARAGSSPHGGAPPTQLSLL
jgi:DNA repair photolyase